MRVFALLVAGASAMTVQPIKGKKTVPLDFKAGIKIGLNAAKSTAKDEGHCCAAGESMPLAAVCPDIAPEATEEECCTQLGQMMGGSHMGECTEEEHEEAEEATESPSEEGPPEGMEGMNPDEH